MIDVPPPVRISTPRTPSRTRGRKPRSRVRVPGDVAHGVAAGLAARQPGAAEDADDLRGIVERDVVVLDVLPRGDMAFHERRVLLGDVGEGVELVRVHAAERQLHADHLARLLTLAVDALLEAEGNERVLSLRAAQEFARSTVEVVELALEDRDDVTRDVLVDLGALERTPAAALGQLSGLACRDWLHRLLLS
jgi:hypothetical protein